MAATDDFILPIHAHRTEMLRILSESSLLLITGATGSGKSTMVPQFIVDEAVPPVDPPAIPRRVIITTPTRLAAVRLAARVSGLRGFSLGSSDCEVGYSIGGERSGTSSRVLIEYVTIGVLKERLIRLFKTLSRFGLDFVSALGGITHVILDEVHERTVDVDTTLFFLRRMLILWGRERERLRNVGLPETGGGSSQVSFVPKIILMSATVSASVFVEYFGKAGCEVPHLSVKGSGEMRGFLVRVGYLEQAVKVKGSPGARNSPEVTSEIRKLRNLPVFRRALEGRSGRSSSSSSGRSRGPGPGRDILRHLSSDSLVGQFDKHLKELGVGVIVSQHERRRDRKESFLVFLPGLAELTDFERRLIDRLGAKCARQVSIHVIHSSVPYETQKKLFDERHDQRLIILATNMAESSVTLPDIKFVLDFCLFKEMNVNFHNGAEELNLKFASLESLDQRKGRAGRVCHGFCLRLIPQDWVESESVVLDRHIKPEVLRVSLAHLILKLSDMKMSSPESLLRRFITPPDLATISKAYADLEEIGALLPDRLFPSDFGRFIVRFPLTLQSSMLVYLGVVFGVPVEAAILASIATIGDLFYHDRSDPIRSLRAAAEFDGGLESDLIAGMRMYLHFICENGPLQQRRRSHRFGNFCYRYCVSTRSLAELETKLRTVLQRIDDRSSRRRNDTLITQDDAHRMLAKFGDGNHVDLLRLLVGASFYRNLTYVDAANVVFSKRKLGSSGAFVIPAKFSEAHTVHLSMKDTPFTKDLIENLGFDGVLDFHLDESGRNVFLEFHEESLGQLLICKISPTQIKDCCEMYNSPIRDAFERYGITDGGFHSGASSAVKLSFTSLFYPHSGVKMSRNSVVPNFATSTNFLRDEDEKREQIGRSAFHSFPPVVFSSQRQRGGGGLFVENCTKMPSFSGLSEILALIFATKVRAAPDIRPGFVEVAENETIFAFRPPSSLSEDCIYRINELRNRVKNVAHLVRAPSKFAPSKNLGGLLLSIVREYSEEWWQEHGVGRHSPPARDPILRPYRIRNHSLISRLLSPFPRDSCLHELFCFREQWRAFDFEIVILRKISRYLGASSVAGPEVLLSLFVVFLQNRSSLSALSRCVARVQEKHTLALVSTPGDAFKVEMYEPGKKISGDAFPSGGALEAVFESLVTRFQQDRRVEIFSDGNRLGFRLSLRLLVAPFSIFGAAPAQAVLIRRKGPTLFVGKMSAGHSLEKCIARLLARYLRGPKQQLKVFEREFAEELERHSAERMEYPIVGGYLVVCRVQKYSLRGPSGELEYVKWPELIRDVEEPESPGTSDNVCLHTLYHHEIDETINNVIARLGSESRVPRRLVLRRESPSSVMAIFTDGPFQDLSDAHGDRCVFDDFSLNRGRLLIRMNDVPVFVSGYMMDGEVTLQSRLLVEDDFAESLNPTVFTFLWPTSLACTPLLAAMREVTESHCEIDPLDVILPYVNMPRDGVGGVTFILSNSDRVRSSFRRIRTFLPPGGENWGSEICGLLMIVFALSLVKKSRRFDIVVSPCDGHSELTVEFLSDSWKTSLSLNLGVVHHLLRTLSHALISRIRLLHIVVHRDVIPQEELQSLILRGLDEQTRSSLCLPRESNPLRYYFLRIQSSLPLGAAGTAVGSSDSNRRPPVERAHRGRSPTRQTRRPALKTADTLREELIAAVKAADAAEVEHLLSDPLVYPADAIEWLSDDIATAKLLLGSPRMSFSGRMRTLRRGLSHGHLELVGTVLTSVSSSYRAEIPLGLLRKSLRLACRLGNELGIRVVEFLITHSGDWNMGHPNSFDFLASLRVAVEAERSGVVKCLLENDVPGLRNSEDELRAISLVGDSQAARLVADFLATPRGFCGSAWSRLRSFSGPLRFRVFLCCPKSLADRNSTGDSLGVRSSWARRRMWFLCPMTRLSWKFHRKCGPGKAPAALVSSLSKIPSLCSAFTSVGWQRLLTSQLRSSKFCVLLSRQRGRYRVIRLSIPLPLSETLLGERGVRWVQLDDVIDGDSRFRTLVCYRGREDDVDDELKSIRT